jgi:DNA-binding response OmpR family regulator
MRRVLIADDDPPLRGLIEVLLRRNGLEVETVSDGAAAIARLETGDYSVLILDLMMPRMSGYDVISFIDSMKRRPAVIVVTAMETSRYLALSQSVTTIVRKPFDIEIFGAMVAAVAMAMDGAHPAAISDLRDSPDAAHS